MQNVYFIPSWDKKFENSQSRKIKKLTWVPIPVDFDEDYLELVVRPNGAAYFGVWMVIVMIAAKCSTRGTLAWSNGLPMSAANLAHISRMPLKLLEKVLPVLMEIGLLAERKGA
jgi:hypothetical protein